MSIKWCVLGVEFMGGFLGMYLPVRFGWLFDINFLGVYVAVVF